MDTKLNLFAKHFRKYTVTVLMVASLLIGHQFTVFAAPTLEIGGNTSVGVRACSVEHSADALASIRKDGEDKVILYANLSQPGDWACFSFTIENSGSVDVRLTDVTQTVDAPDDLLVTFGITEKDVGELLKAGEQCELSIVAQLDPEKEDSLSASGDFALTLVYEAGDTVGDGSNDKDGSDAEGVRKPPQTGDNAYLILAFGCMLLSAALLLYRSSSVTEKRMRRKQKRDNRISE